MAQSIYRTQVDNCVRIFYLFSFCLYFREMLSSHFILAETIIACPLFYAAEPFFIQRLGF